MRNFIRPLLIALPVIALATACKKEYDSPPIRTLAPGDRLTVADLRNMFVNNGSVPIQWRDSSAKSVYAVVTADEQNGNLYKNVYVQDHTGGLVLRLLNSGGLYQGDSIRIYLPGTTLSAYQGLLQIDSVDVDNNIVKQATNVWVEPQTVSIAQLGEAINILSPMQGKLVKLLNVQFIGADTAQTYANAAAQATMNRTLENCSGNTVIMRNSGYANFAGQPLPNGKGPVTAVVGVFGTTVQLFIRNVDEVQLNGPRCGENCVPVATVDETFNDVLNNTNLDLECWTNVFTVGSRPWRGLIVDGQHCAEGSATSFEPACESWLISPPVNYSPGMALAFSSALSNAWLSNGLTVWVSTDINLTNATNVSNAPWQQLTGLTLAGNGSATGEWVPSGNADLSPLVAVGQPFVIGFKYNGAGTQATKYRIDNVVIQ